MVDDVSRNKINKALATATGKWKAAVRSRGHLILPLVFTHQKQIKGKVARNPKVQHAVRCFADADADGLWIVDADLRDESGGSTMDKRYLAVVNLHEELNEKIESTFRVAGPYWGLNLVLWSKGLVDYAAIGVGGGYQYLLSGAIHGFQPKARLAISPIRRRTVAAPGLKSWIQKALKGLSNSHPAYPFFKKLDDRYAYFAANDKIQVANFYKRWFDKIANTPKIGRSMALYQDLSSAYALGKSLSDLPDSVRRPEAVAQSLMLRCL
jgi:hypothetical protein